MKHRYIKDELILDYISRVKQVNRDVESFKWQKHLLSLEEQEAYAELLLAAQSFLKQIEDELTKDQLRVMKAFFFMKVSTQQELSDELGMSITTIHRQRQQIMPIIEKNWKQHKIWFDTYMPQKKEEQ
ncbi:MAG: hypothetical protein ACRDCC_08640 [Culicoidibacterales bacterium]